MTDILLSRREQQIMDSLHTLGRGSARDIATALQEIEALDSIRVTLISLEHRGVVRHHVDGRTHVYFPAQSPAKAREAALTRLTRTFFGGSAEKAMVALMNMQKGKVDEAAIDEIERWVRTQNRSRRKK